MRFIWVSVCACAASQELWFIGLWVTVGFNTARPICLICTFHKLKTIVAVPCKNVSSNRKRRPKSACAVAQSGQVLRYLEKKKSLDTLECFNREQMPGWDFTHVQDDVNQHILRMLEGTLFGADQFISIFQIPFLGAVTDVHYYIISGWFPMPDSCRHTLHTMENWR